MTMSPHVETFNSQLLSSKKLLIHAFYLHGNEQYTCNADLHLRRLEEKLKSFDAEKMYRTIQEDLESKYQLAAHYYEELNKTRDELLQENKVDPSEEQHHKAELQKRLDQVVNTLRTDFAKFIHEFYAVFDGLFVLNTNTFSQQELNDLEGKVSQCLATADNIYNEEYRKMERIYELLEKEGLRLNKALEVK